jgi:hypothetical protein
MRALASTVDKSSKKTTTDKCIEIEFKNQQKHLIV